MYSLLPFLASLSFLSVGLIVFFRDRKNILNISFFLFCLTTFGWQFTWSVLFYLNDQVSLLIKCGYFFIVFIPPTYYQFVMRLIRAKHEQRIIKANYIIACVFVFFLLTGDWFIAGHYQYSWGFYPRAGVLHYFYMLFVIALCVRGFYLIYRKFSLTSGKFREQFRYAMLTQVIYYLGALDYLDNYGWGIYPFGFVFVLLFSLIFAYAITKHELMDIKLLVTRSTAYIVAFLPLMVSFLIVNYLVSGVIWLVLYNTALALFWGLYYVPLRKLIQTPLEEKWITDHYDPEKIINNIALKLVSVLDYRQVFQIITAEIKNTIKIKEAFIITAKRNKDTAITAYEIIRDNTLAIETIPIKYPLIETMQHARRPFVYDDLDVYVKNTMSGYEFPKNALLIPLSSATELEGVIVLGQKISEDRYSETDLQFFQTIISYSLAVLDRIKPYEKAKSEFEASQKRLYDTERQLARSEKIASLANLIQEYNHEIKTPLAILVGKIMNLPEDNEAVKKFKEEADKYTGRIGDIVRTTLRLSSVRERQQIAVKVNEVLDRSLEMVKPDGIKIIKEYGDLPVIQGDPDDLQMVFMNLIKNANEAMPDGGELKITAKPDSGKILLEFADTGCGIPEANYERIFEPFFSTHVTAGRGLGLSIVFRIVREHLGAINVKSKVGVGTTFTIELPVA